MNGDRKLQVVERKPPAPIKLNEATVRTIEAARRAELTSVGSVEELFASLNEDGSQK
jgi:hypothetical protein